MHTDDKAIIVLESRGNYSARSNNMKLVHWPLMGGLLHWYSEEGPGRAAAPPSPLFAVPNVTAHSSAASVPITVLLYDGPLLCGFNVVIKGLTCSVVYIICLYTVCLYITRVIFCFFLPWRINVFIVFHVQLSGFVVKRFRPTRRLGCCICDVNSCCDWEDSACREKSDSVSPRISVSMAWKQFMIISHLCDVIINSWRCTVSVRSIAARVLLFSCPSLQLLYINGLYLRRL